MAKNESRPKFKVGDMVKILSGNKTDKFYGFNIIMQKMVASKKNYVIEKVDSDRIKVNDYLWHPDDLINITTYNEELKEQIFNFDVSKLDS